MLLMHVVVDAVSAAIYFSCCCKHQLYLVPVLQAPQGAEASVVAPGLPTAGGFAMAVAEPESDDMSAADIKVG